MNIKRKKQQSFIERFYLKYEHLAYNYANQIFNFERQGLEYEDVVQEFKIKIYTSIVAYAKKWKEYRDTGRYKPVPMLYYIKSSLVNRSKDFIKQFNLELVENIDKISVQDNKFDYSTYSTVDSNIDINKLICEINGVDIFEGLDLASKRCLALIMKGFSPIELSRRMKTVDVEGVLQKQRVLLLSRKNELYDFVTNRYQVMSIGEED